MNKVQSHKSVKQVYKNYVRHLKKEHPEIYAQYRDIIEKSI